MISFFNSFPFWIGTLIASLFTFFVTMFGSSIVFLFKKVNKNILDAMLSLAAGVMLAASFWSLLNPAIESANNISDNPWFILLVGFLFGTLFLFLIDKIINKKFNKKNYKIKRKIMLILSITLHNIPEGLSIGVSFGSLVHNYSDAALFASIMLAVGIGIQNFPEGSSVSLPLKREGVSNGKSFLIGSLTAIVEPISALIGYGLVVTIKNIMPYMLSFAAAAMIYVVFEELIPESQKNKNQSLMTLFALIGFAIMMVLDIIIK